MADTATALHAAVRWLMNSGIQKGGNEPLHRGGVHAWYDLKKQEHSFLYPEITGYYLTTLLFLHSRNPEITYLEHAIAGGEWLLREARDRKTGAFRCRLSAGAWLPRVCAFDNGMCVNGLVHLYHATKERKYLEAAQEVGAWLLSSMQKPDGSFSPKYDADRDAPWEKPDGKWSLRSGAYLAKLAIGFLNLADAASDDRFASAAHALCAFALTQQEPDGRFRTEATSADTFVHPHCYAAEGLLVAGLTFGEKKYLDAARKAVAWVLPHQLPTGGFPAYFEKGKFLPIESPDISAQVLRLAFLSDPTCHAERSAALHVLRLRPSDSAQHDTQRRAKTKHGVARHHNFTGDKPFLQEARNRCISHILNYQCREKRREADGGFFSGEAWFYPSAQHPVPQHVNSWVTMFCTQALALKVHQSSLQSPFLMV